MEDEQEKKEKESRNRSKEQDASVESSQESKPLVRAELSKKESSNTSEEQATAVEPSPKSKLLVRAEVSEKKEEEKPKVNKLLSKQLAAVSEIGLEIERIADHGEDAPPLITTIQDSTLLLVCDGLGGAGSRKLLYHEEEKKEAYVASRKIAELTKRFFLDHKGKTVHKELITAFQNYLYQELRAYANTFVTAPSKLKTKLIKRLPSTIAGCLVETTSKTAKIDLFWAGDSRVYLLTPKYGLQQLSRDHLRENFDAFENISEDSRMSNFINADDEFEISHHRVAYQEPFILFCATDGVFDYLPTPMHLEQLLLQQLVSSEGLASFIEQVKSALLALPIGDDATIALMHRGWGSHSELKEAFRDRLHSINKDYMDYMEEVNKEFHALKEEQLRLEKKMAEISAKKMATDKELWAKYKSTYYKQADL